MYFKYKTVREKLKSDELGEYEAAGIEIVDECGRQIELESDISASFEPVELAVKLFNEVSLRPSVFKKAVEDIFYS